MNLFLMIAIVILNIVAICMVYHFIKKLPKKEILVFIAISVAIMYVLILIVYGLSGIGIDKKIHESTKNFVTYMFVPVNVIIVVPYIASKYMRLRQNKIKKEELTKNIIIIGIILFVVLFGEYFYFCNIQKNIKYISNETNTTKIETQNLQENNTVTNNIITNS